MQTLKDFKLGKLKVLVATEIVARGIDVANLSHVINYELPNEPESYVHRIGRTARAGNDGIAYSFCCNNERNYLRDIEKLIKLSIPVIKHDKHSDFAQNATGKDAKPLPRGGLGNFKPSKKKGGFNKKNFKNNKNNSNKKSYKPKNKFKKQTH